MNLSRHINGLVASALGLSVALTPFAGLDFALAQNAPVAEAPADMSWQKEFEAWRSASKANTKTNYQAYLAAFPSGKFAGVARKRIDQLNGVATADVVKVETMQTAVASEAKASVGPAANAAADEAEKKRDLALWRDASKTGKQADYEHYLKEFPKGRFAKVARTRLGALTGTAVIPVEQKATDAGKTELRTDKTAQADQVKPANSQTASDTQKTDDKAAVPDWQQEYAVWKAASDGNTIKEYSAYLKAYPNGKFAAIAQARIAQLDAAEQPATTIDEGDDSEAEVTTKVQPNTAPVDRKAREQAQQRQQAEDQDNQARQNRRDQQAEDQAPADQDQMDQSDQAGMDDDQANDPSRQSNAGQVSPRRGQFDNTAGSPDEENAYLDRESRHEIQGRLTSLGYDTYGSDGAFGPNTRTAISGWQQDNGAPTNGYLSEDQIAKIRRQSEGIYDQWVEDQQAAAQPRRRKVIVEERHPGVDAAVAVGVVGTVVAVERYRRHGHRFEGRVRYKHRYGCRRRWRC